MSTICHQIICNHCSEENEVRTGNIVFADIDRIVNMDTVSNVKKSVERLGKGVNFPDKMVIVFDHHVPPCNTIVAQAEREARLFFKDIKNFYDIGRGGICHLVVPEEGLCLPGDLIVGTDSHSCTYGAFGCMATGIGYDDAAVALAIGKLWLRIPEAYKIIVSGYKNEYVCGKDIALELVRQVGVGGAIYKSLEFTGSGLKNLDISDRISICNMAVEMGAKTAIFETDDVIKKYFQDVHKILIGKNRVFHVGQDNDYERIIHLDISAISPLVAVPDLPSNVKKVKEIESVKIDQAVIGSCSNGTIDDMRMAANVIRGHKIQRNVRMIVLPGTQQILRQMIKEGIADTFIEAGAILGPPTCGPCSGNHFGLLADGEVCIATTNRNFTARMGSPKSEVYLANPAVVAASAIKGAICHPEEIVK